MPGSVIVHPDTYASALMMQSSPKEVFGQNGVQETTRDGEKKWVASVAISYTPDYNGIVSPAEVLNVGIVGEDPGIACPPGTSVMFDMLRQGVSAPEQRERKDGNGTRVTGGKPFYTARAIKPAAAANTWSKKDTAA